MPEPSGIGSREEGIESLVGVKKYLHAVGKVGSFERWDFLNGKPRRQDSQGQGGLGALTMSGACGVRAGCIVEGYGCKS